MIDDFYRRLHDTVATATGDAYVHGANRVGYPDFMRMARRIHSTLRDRKRSPVVTLGTKAVETYASVLAILLSGNTWVPCSASAPALRNREIIADLNPALILTDLDLPEPILSLAAERGIPVVDQRILAVEGAEVAFDPTGFAADDLAMIYFTSGSTGAPKGVLISHRNYIAVIENLIRMLPWKTGDVFADYHDLSFVISIPILFPCWLNGGAIAPALDAAEAFLPIDNLVANRVSVLITVPSTVARIRRMRPDGIDGFGLNILINCGEPLHLDILAYSLKLSGSGNVYNFYGSTEVAPWTFSHRCRPEDVDTYAPLGYAPIGKLLPGNLMRVDAATDELLVAGPQVTPGYLHGRDPHRFEVIDGQRWYRTGDKVVGFEGVQVCKGRLDAQVKVGGYRVELTDTEAHLRTLDGVEGAVCFTDGEDASRIIVAALHAARPITLAEVRDHLKERLPAYMIPRRVFTLTDVPINKNGKLDRFAIREAYGRRTLAEP